MSSSSGAGKVFVYSVAGFVWGTFMFVKSFKSFKEKKMIESTPTSKVRGIAMGQVELQGTVIENKAELVTAPFSKKQVAYCYYTIEEYRSSGKSSRWVTIQSGTIGKYFFLKDNTGAVLVDPKGAKADLPKVYETKSLTQSIIDSLKGYGISHKGLIFNKNLRFREYSLKQDDKIYIMGYAGDNPFVEDGSSDKNELDIMIQKGNSDFYYISNKSEKEVLDKFGWKVFGGMFGGGALMIICLFFVSIVISIGGIKIQSRQPNGLMIIFLSSCAGKKTYGFDRKT